MTFLSVCTAAFHNIYSSFSREITRTKLSVKQAFSFLFLLYKPKIGNQFTQIIIVYMKLCKTVFVKDTGTLQKIHGFPFIA